MKDKEKIGTNKTRQPKDKNSESSHSKGINPPQFKPTAQYKNENGMPLEVQAKMENAFQSDFSNVSVKTNSEMAKGIGADALTQGEEIHFAPGKYNPDSTSGQQIIGHELAHVVQQRNNKVPATSNIGDLKVNVDSSLENEADNLGNKAADEDFPYDNLIQQNPGEMLNEELSQFKTMHPHAELKEKRSMLLGGKDQGENESVSPIQDVTQFLCSSSKPTIQDMEKYNSYMQKADQAISAGAHAFDAVGNSQAAEKLRDGKNALNKVSGPLGKGLDFANKAQDLTKVAVAINNLNNMDIYSDPHGAAAEFDTLFSTVGKIGSTLPIPGVSHYFELLSNCGNFFSNMARKLRPGARWGDKFREIGMPELAE